MTFFGTILFVFFILSSCGPTKHEYPLELSQDFMDSCLDDVDSNKNLCLCLLNQIQDEYTVEEFFYIRKKSYNLETLRICHFLFKCISKL
jgi:hypothetical protein